MDTVPAGAAGNDHLSWPSHEITRYWLSPNITTTDPIEVQQAVKITRFTSGHETFDLIYFSKAKDEPNILISQGSGGHAYVFAELAYRLHLAGYNVFVIPKHGGWTVDQLLTRHRDALRHIAMEFHSTIGVYGEGLGGYVAFYLALAHAPIGSLVCQPPAAQLVIPALEDLLDTRQESRDVERRLVLDGYLNDPDFDHWCPLSAIMSLLTTPPPAPLDQLNTPTMFVIASQGPTPSYITDLYHRLPAIEKKLTNIDGSVYWMLSHPQQAAQQIHEWLTTTLRHT